MSHYFIDDNTLADDFRTIKYNFSGKRLEYVSNAGLFSHGEVDAISDTLLRNLPKLEGSLLDLGCGWGLIGVALGAAYGVEVTMSDVNQRALECVALNAENNKVDADIILSDCCDNINSTFDTITLNPPVHAGKQVMFRMYEEAHERLNSGGRFFVVIQKKHGAESTIKKLSEIFGESNTKIIYHKKGVFIVESTR